MVTDPARYCIRVKGQLGSEWSEWFGGMSITSDETNETILSGQVVDQAALYGILNQIGALGLTLLSVLREASPSSEDAAHMVPDHGERSRVALE
jgi:hypothetical protein